METVKTQGGNLLRKPVKSRSRRIYEKLHASDQREIDIRTGRAQGITFTKDWPTVSFEQAVKDVVGKPGTYTTKPGGALKRRATIGQ